jgi:hypothetical protein
MSTAPDYVEPVEGWRVWAVVERARQPRLASLYHDAVWQPGEALVGGCLRRRAVPLWRRGRLDSTHDTPELACTCGIYAAASPRVVLPYLTESPAGGAELCRVIGRVALWG